jgi:hypothetical protein
MCWINPSEKENDMKKKPASKKVKKVLSLTVKVAGKEHKALSRCYSPSCVHPTIV